MDEVFAKIGGVQHYLCRAVDQGGEVVYVFLQKAAMPQQQVVSSNDYSKITRDTSKDQNRQISEL